MSEESVEHRQDRHSDEHDLLQRVAITTESTATTVAEILLVLNGRPGTGFGVVQKVSIMWAAHVPIVAVLSALAGAAVNHYFGH